MTDTPNPRADVIYAGRAIEYDLRQANQPWHTKVADTIRDLLALIPRDTPDKAALLDLAAKLMKAAYAFEADESTEPDLHKTSIDLRDAIAALQTVPEGAVVLDAETAKVIGWWLYRIFSEDVEYIGDADWPKPDDLVARLDGEG